MASYTGNNKVTVFLNDTEANATTPVVTAVDFDGGTTPRVLVGDFNADGRVDFASANQAGANVTVFLNATTTPGALVFDGTSPSFRNFPAGAQPLGADAVDVDLDGRLDIVVGNTFANTLSVLLGL